MPNRGAILSLAVALLLTACGGSASGGHGASRAPAASVSQVRACSVFTAQDAAALLGGSVGNTVDTQPDSGSPDIYTSSCRYQMTDSPYRAVDVSIDHYESAASAKAFYTNEKQALRPKVPLQDVPGVGEDAYYVPGLGLHALRSPFILQIVVSGTATPADALGHLGTTIVGRMKG
jgi:hypothetical protein